MINAVAISSFTPFLENFPQFERIIKDRGFLDVTKDWDFFMTVAGIGVAVRICNNQLSPEFFDTLQRYFPKIDPNASAAFEDLLKFAERNSEKMDPIEACGTWVVFNVKQETPTNDEMSIGPVIGKFLASNLDGWWN